MTAMFLTWLLPHWLRGIHRGCHALVCDLRRANTFGLDRRKGPDRRASIGVYFGSERRSGFDRRSF